jgi:RNA polymerase sigma-B factor
VVGAVPRELQRLSIRVDRTVTDLVRRLGRQPTMTELARAVGVTEERVLEALEASCAYRADSLEAPHSAGDEPGETVGDLLGSADGRFELAEHRATLGRLLRVLTPRGREVVALRFEHDLTQADIGERIGVSQMQVSGILRGAMARVHVLVGEAA